MKTLRVNWKHTCSCSVETQNVGRKVSRFYQGNISGSRLETLLELVEKNYTSTNVFRKQTTKMGLTGGIQAIDISNLRTREFWLRFTGKKLTIDDVTQWIERPSIVEYFPNTILNGDVAVTQAK